MAALQVIVSGFRDEFFVRRVSTFFLLQLKLVYIIFLENRRNADKILAQL